MYKKSIILMAVLILGATGCKEDKSKTVPLQDRKINLVTTIGMITDIASIVGGERVQVTGLIPAGVDPHLYRASSGNVSTMTKADLVFYGGLHLEGKLVDILEHTDRFKTVAVTKDIPLDRLLEAQAGMSGIYDPHVWFDVTLWQYAVATIRDSLIEMDPASKDSYEQNAQNYLRELDELHRYVKAKAEQLPLEKRVLITAHDAFGYFGKQYGFEVLGLQGISTVTEAKVSD